MLIIGLLLKYVIRGLRLDFGLPVLCTSPVNVFPTCIKGHRHVLHGFAAVAGLCVCVKGVQTCGSCVAFGEFRSFWTCSAPPLLSATSGPAGD